MGLSSHAVMAVPAVVSFDPLTLTPTRWWKVSDASTVTLSSTAITQVNDKSGNTGHLTQGTASARPTIVSGGLNFRDYASLDGGDYMSAAAFTLAQPFTMFAVVKQTVDLGTGVNGIIAASAGGSQAIAYFSKPTGTALDVRNSMWAGTALTQSATTHDFGWHVITASFNGASSTVRVDGTQVASGAAGATTVSGAFTVGAGAAGATPMTGGWVEFLICATPTTALRDGYEASLKSLYGTP